MDPEIARDVAYIPPVVGNLFVSAGVSLVDRMIDTIPAVQRHQADRITRRILERLTTTEDEFLNRLRTDPAVFRLVADTLHAAAWADNEAKLEALSVVASSGLNDSALLDESRYIVGVLSELDVIHVRILAALDQVETTPKSRFKVADLIETSEGISDALTQDLLRLALVKAPGMTFTGVHHGVAGLTSFGEQILAVLRSGEWRR
ncbi:MAG: hypothetical protein ACLFWH_01290 [Actinomycetota bacterium]